MNKNSFFRPILFLFTITLLSASQLFAAESSVPLRPYIAPKDDQDAEFANIVAKLDTVQAPFIQGQNLVFTAKNNARHIGIAFEHEEYKTIHSFKIRNIYDADYKVQESLQFFIIKLPKDVQVVRYRLIIDGLWTTDPYNSNKTYSDKCGVLVSQVDANRSIPFVTEQKKDGRVHFVYKGTKGQQIRLGGSFTNWDSWIYTMRETTPGIYEFDLPLPPGTYQYAFYNGMNTLVDRTNPIRCYAPDGKEASQITIQ